MFKPVVFTAVVLGLILGAADVLAVDPTATLSLPNPGARSMALGGAFVAQADDATAAFANPAGLVQLLDPEVSAELRFWLYSSDGKDGFSSDDSEVVDVSAVGFLSGVYPIGPVSIALYRNQLAKIDVNQEFDNWYSDVWNISAFEIVTWGLSGAYRVNEDLSFGLGVAYNEGAVETLVDGVSVRTSADEWSFNAGLLWKPTQTLSLGGFYRQGANLDVPEAGGSGVDVTASPLSVPDVYGLGVAWRSSGGSVALLGEWDHVRHSTVDGAVLGDTVVRFDDTDELHAGAEYVFLSTTPLIAIRLGAWYDPAHRALIEGATESQLDKNEIHGAGGMGLAWEHFQLDFALDVSDPVITLSVSGIVSF